MRILKLPWLSHRAEDKTLACYALDINTIGTKLASGGLDGKVKVWDLWLLLKVSGVQSIGTFLQIMGHPQSATPERPLASMSRHNGVVTSVKFSPDGRYLVSGSDDKIVLVWEKDDEQAPRPKQFGETEADLEHWTVRKRLVAHDNDVQDICWSPDGQLLITVGLDRSIIIWSGTTFERIKRYDIHQSMVKGVVFDPANKFFATASDDRTVRVFRYYKKVSDLLLASYEFQMEQVIVDPFRKSPLTSYFRRMLWSPDGQHVAVPNATNGPVTSVAIINRGNWASDVSLIGHEAPCEVCLFLPRLFKIKGEDEDKHTTILATGGQDRTLAIWSTAMPKPLVVMHDIVQKSITDIAWTPDGMLLFLSSLDGLVTCVTFTENELGEPVSGDAIGSQLERYGGDRDLTIMVESVDQLQLERLSKHMTKTGNRAVLQDVLNTSDNGQLSLPHNQSIPQPFQPPFPPKTSSVPTILNTSISPRKAKKTSHNVVVTKNGRKRVAPTLISTYAGTANGVGGALPSTSTPLNSISRTFRVSSKLSQTAYLLPKMGLPIAVHGLRPDNETPVKGQNDDQNADNNNEDMGFDDPNSSQLQTLTAAGIRMKMKNVRKHLILKKYPTPFKKIAALPEALFANQQMMNNALLRLMQTDQVTVSECELVNTSSLESIDESVFFGVIVSSSTHKKVDFFDGNTDTGWTRSVIEVRNGPAWAGDDEIVNTDPAQRTDFQDPTQVIVTTNDETETAENKNYILYFPFRIQHAVPVIISDRLLYYVLISFEGTVQVIRAHTGSFFMPSFEVGSNVIAIKQKGNFFTALTSLGQLFCWRFPDLSTSKSGLEKVLAGVSVAPILSSNSVLAEDSDGLRDPKNGSLPSTNTTVVVDNISALEINETDGMPLVAMEKTGSIYAYSRDLMAWTQVVDPWYFLAYKMADCSKENGKFLGKTMLHYLASLKHEKIQRGHAVSYRFDETNRELQECMRARLEELSLFI